MDEGHLEGEEEHEQQLEVHMVSAQVTTQGERIDSSMSQWLSFSFQKKEKIVLSSITLQEAIVESSRRTKRAKTLHHLSRSDSGDVIVSIIALTHDMEEGSHGSPKYQISQVNLGKQTKWEK